MEDEEKKAATPTPSDQQPLAPQLSTAVFEALRQTSTGASVDRCAGSLMERERSRCWKLVLDQGSVAPSSCDQRWNQVSWSRC
ncbi:hypothetical protein PF003_g14225 [Phytophthora fragariae]|nr:hypothetical protein PF003_g14225 [Phytophthora fragariae]